MKYTRFLSLNEASRRVDAPYALLQKLVETGELKPDGISGRSLLFDVSRVDEIQKLVRQKRPTPKSFS
jgi:hypothetical protein